MKIKELYTEITEERLNVGGEIENFEEIRDEMLDSFMDKAKNSDELELIEALLTNGEDRIRFIEGACKEQLSNKSLKMYRKSYKQLNARERNNVVIDLLVEMSKLKDYMYFIAKQRKIV